MNTIQSKWELYKKTIPDHASQEQFNATKRAFYAGAMGLCMLQQEVCASNFSDDVSAALMKSFNDELYDFASRTLAELNSFNPPDPQESSAPLTRQ